MPYKILVLDNFHFMDEDEEYELEPVPTAEAALALAKQRLDADLLHHFKPGMTAKELYSYWSSFGELPLVQPVGDEPRVEFSGLDYARKRAAEVALVSEWQRWAAEQQDR